MNEKIKGGGSTPLCFPPSLRYPPPDSKKAQDHTARGLGRSSLCQPTDQDFPQRPMGTEATYPCLVSHQEELRLLRKDQGRNPDRSLAISSETTVEVSFHSYQPQPGFPKEATSTQPRPLACPEGHWVWPLADSQANLTEPEKPKPYSSVFPNKICAHSDELCEVTRSAV